jgi:hypothetical protein
MGIFFYLHASIVQFLFRENIIFVFYVCPAQKLSFTLFPLYCIFFFTWHSWHGIFLTELPPEFFPVTRSLQKYYTCTPCFKQNPFSTCTQHLLFMKQHKPAYLSHIAVLIRGTACQLSPLGKPALHLNTLRYKIIIILCVLTKYEMIPCQRMDTGTCFE